MLKSSQSSYWLQEPQAAQQRAASRCCTGSQDFSGRLSQLVLSASMLGTHLDAPADVIHNPDCPTVLVSWQGLGESGDLHLPFGLGTSFFSVDGFTGGALQTAILPGERSHIRAPQHSHLQAGLLRWASSVPCSRWSTWPACRACGRSAGSSSGGRLPPA